MKRPEGWIYSLVSIWHSRGGVCATYVVDGVVVNVLGGDHLLDDLLLKLLAELLGGDIGRVLGGDDDGVDALGDDGAVVVLILNGDLGLGVGPQPREGAIATRSGHGSVELVGEEESEGEELRGLVGGVAEHDTLVTGTKLLKSLLVVKALSNIGRLLLDGDEQVEGLVVEALLGIIVADVLDGVTDDLLVVELGLGGDLAEDHDHAGLGGSLASDLGEGVLGQTGVENGIGDLVSDLVGVTLADGLGLDKQARLATGRERLRRQLTSDGAEAYGEEEAALVVVLDTVGTVGSHCEDYVWVGGVRRRK